MILHLGVQELQESVHKGGALQGVLYWLFQVSQCYEFATSSCVISFLRPFAKGYSQLYLTAAHATRCDVLWRFVPHMMILPAILRQAL